MMAVAINVSLNQRVKKQGLFCDLYQLAMGHSERIGSHDFIGRIPKPLVAQVLQLHIGKLAHGQVYNLY